MEQTPELTKALSELKRLTGLTMQITADTPEETATALEQMPAVFVLLIVKNIIKMIFF